MARVNDFGLRRARWSAASIVAALVAIGVVTTIGSSTQSVWRELGLAVVSGGLVGGALTYVESMLAFAESRRAEHAALLGQMYATTELPGIDLRGHDLTGLYLPGRNFVAGHLQRVHLDGAKLYYGSFRHANLIGASLRGADVSGSTFVLADLRDADLTGANLRDVDLSRADLRGAILAGVDLTGARIQGASFAGAKLDGAKLDNCYLEGTDFTGSSVGKATFAGPVQYDAATTWPAEFVAPSSGVVVQPAIKDMKLDNYLAWRAEGPSSASL